MIDLETKMLSIKEVMEIAGVSRYTIYRDIKSGKIPAVHFGVNVRIKESDALNYAKEKSKSSWVAYYKKKRNEQI